MGEKVVSLGARGGEAGPRGRSAEEVDVRIAKETLNKAVSALERVVKPRAANPLSTYVRAEPLEGGLALAGTDEEVDLEVRLEGEADGLGREPFLIPGAPFLTLARSLPGEEAELRREGRVLEIRSGSFHTSLSLAQAEGYPELSLPGEEGEGRFGVAGRLAKDLFLRGFSAVRYAAAKESYRGVFCGVQIELREDGLRFVASDGYRLALQDLPASLGLSARVVVPARGGEEAARVLSALEGEEVVLAARKGALGLVLQGEGVTARMALRLLEGEFPDYERVIPQEFALEAEVETEALAETLKRLAVLSDGENRRVDLLFEEGRIKASADGLWGQGEEEVEAETRGPALALAFNARYLLEALAPVEGRARLRASGPQTPVLVEPAEGGGYRAAVMPLRVS